MRQLSSTGQQIINAIAHRHGFSPDAVLSMLESVINGNGTMAQFNHPEFSGSGQWMQGGMTMVSDIFNNHLKGRVDALCFELADVLAHQTDLISSGNFQSQSQGHNNQQQNNYGGEQQQNGSGPVGAVSLFIPPAPGSSGNWWPADLRFPDSTGAQNGVRYAYFSQARRLVIEVNGTVTVYDTLDHQIGGFSQQQSYGGSFSFSSQYGLVDVASLPVISINGIPQQQRPETATPSPMPHNAYSNQPVTKEEDILATIEKLASLHGKGILDNDEFAMKKAELLARL